MQEYFILFSLAAVAFGVIFRSILLKREGIKAIHFGGTDKKDYLIPPFMILYFYLIIAYIFDLPKIGSLMTESSTAAWVGAVLCICAPIVFFWGIYSFGKSFRVGIDKNSPGNLVSSGAFAVSRNPLYVAFMMILVGVFLIFPVWIFFVYLIIGMWRIDHQVCLEENALRKIYGKGYDDYCNRVRRYI